MRSRFGRAGESFVRGPAAALHPIPVTNGEISGSLILASASAFPDVSLCDRDYFRLFIGLKVGLNECSQLVGSQNAL
jgi:hypothetical protein